jgi:hypothetical protein
MISFAETYTSYPDGQQGVGAPPDSVILRGFVPETAGSRGQPLPAQWINWLLQKLFRLANRDVVADADGEGLFVVPDSTIRLEAFDRDNPARYIVAVGWKAADAAPVLTVVSSSTLTLGTGTVGGDQPVLGGDDVIITGYSRQIGDI